MARPDETLQAALDYYRLQEDDLTGPARLDKDVVEARRAAAHLLFGSHGLRAETVAERVGYTSRYSVYHAVDELAARWDEPSVLSQEDRPLTLGAVVDEIVVRRPSPLAAPRQRTKRRDRRLAPKGQSKI